jgi:uncharacterized protein (TIGR03790 family)
MRRRIILVALLALVGFGGSSRADDDIAGRLILLANSNQPASLQVARHYADVRHVPLANIVILPMSSEETVSWSEFIDSIWNPLEAELVQRRWLDSIPMSLHDAEGRTKYSVSGHRISYLVICRGVPLRISNDPARYEHGPSFDDRSNFRANEAAVDSELSLLALPNHTIGGFLTNPLFGVDRPTTLQSQQVIKVSRLDGPALNEVLALPDRAILAERLGLKGRAYVDLGGNHPDGDRWLEEVVRQLEQLRITTVVDRKRTTFPADTPFESPVLYFGWYAERVNGPFLKTGFRFPDGAIAMHIHSFSAETLRRDSERWCGPFVARGVTATVGNVFEPYLQLTHRPDLLLRALARGDTFGDAVYFAQRALSWQTIAIGDPLYRPFPR